MAKIRTKGTILAGISGGLVGVIAQIISIDSSGEQSLDYDATTLDGLVWEEKRLTGYSALGTLKAELFWDPVLHSGIAALIDVPVASVFRISYANGDPTLSPIPVLSTSTFSVAGISFDHKVGMKDGLRGTITLNKTGLPIPVRA